MKNASLETFFKQRHAPAHCCAKDVRATNRPVLRVTSMIQQQVNTYRDLLFEAEADPEYDENLKGMLAALHATFDGLERTCHEWQGLGRRINDLAQQMERQLQEIEGNVQAYEDAGGAAALMEFRDKQIAAQADFRALQLLSKQRKAQASPMPGDRAPPAVDTPDAPAGPVPGSASVPLSGNVVS